MPISIAAIEKARGVATLRYRGPAWKPEAFDLWHRLQPREANIVHASLSEYEREHVFREAGRRDDLFARALLARRVQTIDTAAQVWELSDRAGDFAAAVEIERLDTLERIGKAMRSRRMTVLVLHVARAGWFA